MRTRTTGRHLDGESSVGPDGGPAAIVDADEADAVIGDGALAGVAAEDSAKDSMHGGHGGLPGGRRGSESSCTDGRGHRRRHGKDEPPPETGFAAPMMGGASSPGRAVSGQGERDVWVYGSMSPQANTLCRDGATAGTRRAGAMPSFAVGNRRRLGAQNQPSVLEEERRRRGRWIETAGK